MLVTVIGRGHGGTRAMSHTLSESGVYMGAQLNGSGDLIPPEDLYDACRVMSRHVIHKGGVEWDFTELHTMPIDPEFTRLVESYLSSVLGSEAEHKGWKLPETTLIYPWIVRMFPEIHYIHWSRDPRDSIIGRHVTDDLADFGVPYDKTDDLRLMRAISWKYQREIVKATPPPKRVMEVRFEDFILKQDDTLAKLQTFLGIPLAKIEVRPDSVGRWKTDEEYQEFEFLKRDMMELGYGAD
jgi:hypothetical protein